MATTNVLSVRNPFEADAELKPASGEALLAAVRDLAPGIAASACAGANQLGFPPVDPISGR